MKQLTILLAIFTLACSCSKHEGAGSGATTLPTLPSSWLQGAPAATDESPSPAAEKSVLAAFRVHSAALDELTAPAFVENAALSHPPGWVPWHLEGVIAAFAVDVGGVFGALVGDGDAAVKVTWQKRKNPSKVVPTATKRTAVHFLPGMTSEEMATALEPTVRMAAATGSVHDTVALRRNLQAEAEKFLSTVRILSQLPPNPGWHIDGFQLSVSIGAHGQVTPQFGAGGAIALIFDYQVPSAAVPPPALSSREVRIEKNLEPFVRTLAAIIPVAQAQAGEIRKEGFEFQVFQVGLGITAGGEVGLASASATTYGRIVFKKNALGASFDPAGESLNLIESPLAEATEARVPGATGGEAKPVPARLFTAGLRRAIKMGNFFARQAVKSESATWQTNEIELGFDTNLGGDLKLATVQGVGQIRMGFERVEL